MASASDCRLLTLNDVEPSAQVIAQAFRDDPLCAFMLPQQKTRIQTLVKFFRVYGELSIQSQRGYGVGDPLQGVAFWISPGKDGLSISPRFLRKLVPLLFTSYPIGYLRARAVMSRIDSLRQKYAAEPHYYLDNIGVSPFARRQGLSSRLIRPFLAMADEQGVMAYTDTVTPANVPLYEHFGFQCMEASPISETGLTVWALCRPPK